MVRTVVNLTETEKQIINKVKANYALKNEGQALSLILKHYEEHELEPQLRPEFTKEIEDAKKKGKFTEVKDFTKKFNLK